MIIMAAAAISNGSTTTITSTAAVAGAVDTFGSQLLLESMQTVSPTNPTDPKIYLPVSFPAGAGNLDYSGISSRRFSILLCYKNGSDEDSASLVAGWIRESLGKALSEQPILAGRLRRKDKDLDGGDADNDQLEIVLNDSGVRLIEAQFSMNLQEFLDLEEKKEAESQLVFWDDIDFNQNPQFSPLCYMQVSNFKCGGYAIGISCSLLLFDPFSMATFLKKWSRIHLDIMITRTGNCKNNLPVFYRPKIGNNGFSSRSSRLPIKSRTRSAAAQTMTFEHFTSKMSTKSNHSSKSIAAQCLSESVQKLELKTPKNVSVVLKEPLETDHHHYNKEMMMMICKVQNFAKDEILFPLSPGDIAPVNGISCSSFSNLDQLGIDGVCFREGNKPVHVKCWINSVVDEALVTIFPSPPSPENEGLKIIVALPNN